MRQTTTTTTMNVATTTINNHAKDDKRQTTKQQSTNKDYDNQDDEVCNIVQMQIHTKQSFVVIVDWTKKQNCVRAARDNLDV